MQTAFTTSAASALTGKATARLLDALARSAHVSAVAVEVSEGAGSGVAALDLAARGQTVLTAAAALYHASLVERFDALGLRCFAGEAAGRAAASKQALSEIPHDPVALVRVMNGELSLELEDTALVEQLADAIPEGARLTSR